MCKELLLNEQHETEFAYYVSDDVFAKADEAVINSIFKTLNNLDSIAAKNAHSYEGVYLSNFCQLVNEHFQKPHLAFNLAKEHYGYMSPLEKKKHDQSMLDSGYCPTCGLDSNCCPCGTFEFSDDDECIFDQHESNHPHPNPERKSDPDNELDHWPTPEEGGYAVENKMITLIKARFMSLTNFLNLRNNT